MDVTGAATVVAGRRFALTPWPWNTLAWVRVPDGLEFRLYDVGDHLVNGVAVPCLPGEAARWKLAHDSFEAELRAAEAQVRYAHGVRVRTGLMVDRRTVRLRRHALLPGRAARSRAAFARCAARMRAADAAYRPVRELIEALLNGRGTLPGTGPHD